MLRKITFLYLHHFRFIIFLNLFVSLYFTIFFWYKGFTHYPLYMIALMFKAVAYVISVSVEKFFFQAREYHYRNLGFSYSMLFGLLFIADFLLFLALILIGYTCKNFM